MVNNKIAANTAAPRPYNRVQLFSGGGYRFGYYLGSYAALCDNDLRPELILATCGGSLASLLVDIAADPQDLKQLLASTQLYNVIKASRHRQDFKVSDRTTLAMSKTAESQRPNYFYQGLKRLVLSKNSARLGNIHNAETHDQLLDELNQFAMFEIDNEECWLDELLNVKSSAIYQESSSKHNNPAIAIIASRLLPLDSSSGAQLESNTTANKQAVAAKLQEILFAPASPAFAGFLKQTPELICPTHRYASERIVKDIHVVSDWSMAQAVRASMADMYYLKPTFIESIGWSLGGVIDLTPIELASMLGDTVFAETKSGYDKVLAAPAIQRIFGFNPNQRLDAALSYKLHLNSNTKSKESHIHWLPFADNGKSLSGQHVQKRFNIRHRRVDLIHADYDGFVAQMQAQWQYGYERTTAYLRVNLL